MKGFTLIETMIAVTILIMIIIGPLSLATKSIELALVSQNQITAFYLAQEAIEYVKNVRDNNFLQSASWLNGLSPCWNSDGCYVDIPNNNLNACSANCPKIKYDGGSYYYNYQVGQDTIFTRIVIIDKTIPGNADEAKIKVTVSWPEKFGGQKSFTLQNNIFNWK